MSTRCVINVDLADVWDQRGRKTLRHTIAWGDEITVINQKSTHLEVEVTSFKTESDGSLLPVTRSGFIEPTKASRMKPSDIVVPKEENQVLKVNFVDVQQGDGSVIESPDGKIILVDGGDNQLFARYLAARFRGTTAERPKHIDCILVTHGDADHFSGLVEIHKSETHKDKRKRLFIHPERVYHNGLVKRPGQKNNKPVADRDLLGPTKKRGKKVILTGLVDDLLQFADEEMNQPFRAWKAALKSYNTRGAVAFRRLEFGDSEAFSFFNNGNFQIDVLGPSITDSGGVRGLKFLGEPPKGPRVGHESLELGEDDFKGLSAAHTINGHSVVFRLSYGGFSYLFAGDLNDEAGRFLAREHNRGALNLRSEVFKVPHHGSADFSGGFFQAVSPVVNVVSSGDENARKEYIHPRATLMGALGRWSRVAEPLVFVTELVAFFNVEGWSRLTDAKKSKKRGNFFGFSRSAFGIVKTRTNGQRLLVYTDSGNVKLKEAYAYQLDDSGVPIPAEVRRA
ncbi:MAG: MBL fold metallo-hydrolase [Deltaproteobacteria bacterium]|nr:MBL fold metallo-hydrolase [Deltaproteobacteria bacterium]